jgi:hypothetical protein
MIDPATATWHWDRRLPIALIVTLLVQFGGIVWWGAQQSQRLAAVERTVLSRDDDHERLVRVEATVQSIDARLARMEDRR